MHIPDKISNKKSKTGSVFFSARDIGMIWKRGWLQRPWFANKMVALQKYRKHNACVLKVRKKKSIL